MNYTILQKQENMQSMANTYDLANNFIIKFKFIINKKVDFVNCAQYIYSISLKTVIIKI